MTTTSYTDSPIAQRISRTSSKKHTWAYPALQKTKDDSQYGSNMTMSSVSKKSQKLQKPIFECKTPIQMRTTIQIPIDSQITIDWNETVDYFKDSSKNRASSETSIYVDPIDLETQKIKEEYFTKKVQKDRKPRAFSMTRYKRIKKFLESVQTRACGQITTSAQCIEPAPTEQIGRKIFPSRQQYMEKQQQSISQSANKLSISQFNQSNINSDQSIPLQHDQNSDLALRPKRKSVQKVEDYQRRVGIKLKTIFQTEFNTNQCRLLSTRILSDHLLPLEVEAETKQETYQKHWRKSFQTIKQFHDKGESQFVVITHIDNNKIQENSQSELPLPLLVEKTMEDTNSSLPLNLDQEVQNTNTIIRPQVRSQQRANSQNYQKKDNSQHKPLILSPRKKFQILKWAF